MEQAEEKHEENKQITAKNISKDILFYIGDTKYSVVKYVGKKLMNYKLTKHFEDPWDVMWTDSAITPDLFDKLELYQKVNHFPGMYSLARKNHLANNLMKMKKKFSSFYKFFPKTFLLPADYGEFRAQSQKKKGYQTFIVKPEADCQGRGIYLTRNHEDVGFMDHVVVQEYLSKPFLIDDLKFDMRIYVLLAGCDPLRIYLYGEGLGRFATEKYMGPKESNLNNLYMHLTNYAINKKNPNFTSTKKPEENDEGGHKRKLTTVFRQIEAKGFNSKEILKEIEKMIVKMFCAVQPILAHNYNSCQSKSYANDMCFEILGLDVILDEKGKPYLLEVNHTPSFNSDTAIDREVKRALIRDTLVLLNIDKNHKKKYKSEQKKEFNDRLLGGKRGNLEDKNFKKIKEQKKRDDYESSHLGNYKKIYPLEQEEEPYQDFMTYAKECFEMSTGTKKKVEKVEKIEKVVVVHEEGKLKSTSNIETKNLEIKRSASQQSYKPTPLLSRMSTRTSFNVKPNNLNNNLSQNRLTRISSYISKKNETNTEKEKESEREREKVVQKTFIVPKVLEFGKSGLPLTHKNYQRSYNSYYNLA